MDRASIRVECLKLAAILHQRVACDDDAVLRTAEKFVSFVDGPPSAENQGAKLTVFKGDNPNRGRR